MCWDHLYNIQFFHNLPSINFRMRHVRERKMCQVIITKSFNSFTCNLLVMIYKFRKAKAWQKKKRCAEIIHITFNSSLTYRLYINFRMRHNRERNGVLRSFIYPSILSQLTVYKFQDEAWQRKKICAGIIYILIQFFYNLPPINFRMRHDRERWDVLRSFI